MTTPRNPTPPHDPQRLRELLADQATNPLSAADRAEIASASQAETESMELAAAGAHLALVQNNDPLPDALLVKLQKRADEFAAAPAAPTVLRSPARRPNLAAMTGWLAAAAAIALAVYAWSPKLGRVSTPEEQRQALIDRATDVSVIPWSAWGDAPAVTGVLGDVAWSPSRGEGYLRFRNLSPNDPAKQQYQLWIVDSTRGEPLKVPPVDGGVFNIAASGVVTVPISAKLPVGKAVAFAVTVEPPGGVVVSDQSRKVVVAMVPN